jgi:hypothetical protein
MTVAVDFPALPLGAAAAAAAAAVKGPVHSSSHISGTTELFFFSYFHVPLSLYCNN